MAKASKILALYASYASQLKRTVSKIVGAEDVEDIVQETFVKSYEAELKQEIKYARSYMLKTAKNLALNHIAKWDNKYGEPIEDFAQPPVELSSQSTEKEFESKERFMQFCRATDALSEPVKKAFILKKVYGLSQKEIAKKMQLSESTIEKHIAKGLLHCFEYMERIEQNEINTHTHTQKENKRFIKS